MATKECSPSGDAVRSSERFRIESVPTNHEGYIEATPKEVGNTALSEETSKAVSQGKSAIDKQKAPHEVRLRYKPLDWTSD